MKKCSKEALSWQSTRFNYIETKHNDYYTLSPRYSESVYLEVTLINSLKSKQRCSKSPVVHFKFNCGGAKSRNKLPKEIRDGKIPA